MWSINGLILSFPIRFEGEVLSQLIMLACKVIDIPTYADLRYLYAFTHEKCHTSVSTLRNFFSEIS